MGNVVKVDEFGIGSVESRPPLDRGGRFFSVSVADTVWSPQNGAGWQMSYSPSRTFQSFTTSSSRLFVRYVGQSDEGQIANKSDFPWTEFQQSGTSDINLKNIDGDLDVNQSLLNVEKMEFKNFYYLNDPNKTPRRGITAQQIAQIDSEYVHSAETAGKMTVDLNPLVMDALAAIQALSKKITYLESLINNTADAD